MPEAIRIQEITKIIITNPMKKIFCLCCLTVLFSGCAMTTFDGNWEGEMISTKENTEIQECGMADLLISIEKGAVSGKAIVGYGFELGVVGTVNENGKIDAQLMGDDDAEASITGQMQNSSAGGTWNDRLGCFGTFDLTRK